jgi:FixJ family two-component response regulator
MFVELLYGLSPEPGFMPLFDEVLKAVWKQKQADHEETAAAVARRIAAIEARKQNFVDAVVDGRIDKPTYDAQIA